MHVVVVIGVRRGRRVQQQLPERELSRLLAAGGHVVEQRRVDPTGGHPDDLCVGIEFPHTGFDPLQGGVAFGVGDLIQFVDHDQRSGAVPRGRKAAAVDGVEVRAGVDHVDHSAPAHVLGAAEPDDAGDRHRIRHSAGLDDDGVEIELRVGEFGQRVVEGVVVGQAADTPAGDGRRLVDLPGHQAGIDVEFTKVVDHHTDPRARGAQHVVQERRLARTEIAGQRDDGNRLHPTPSDVLPWPTFGTAV